MKIKIFLLCAMSIGVLWGMKEETQRNNEDNPSLSEKSKNEVVSEYKLTYRGEGDESHYVFQKDLTNDQDFIMIEKNQAKKMWFRLKKTSEGWQKENMKKINDILKFLREQNKIAFYKKSVLPKKNLMSGEIYLEKEITCYQPSNYFFWMHNEYKKILREDEDTNNKNKFEEGRFWIHILSNDYEDESREYQHNFFIDKKRCNGKKVKNFCTDGKEFFLVTEKNEILHYTITINWALFNPIKTVITFNKIYNVNQPITGIEYYKGKSSLILGLEDGTLLILNLNTGKKATVECKDFSETTSEATIEPIADIVLNGCEKNILIASTKKLAIYDIKPFAIAAQSIAAPINQTEIKIKNSKSMWWRKTLGVGLVGLGTYVLWKAYDIWMKS